MRAILTFHSIDNSGAIISYPKDAFAYLIKKLRNSHIPILTLEQLLADDAVKGVAITFDDGMRSVYENALPILKDYHAPAHVFITTAAMDNQHSTEQTVSIEDYKMLNWDEVLKLQENGIHIEAHTHTHPDMRTLSKTELCEDIDKSHEVFLDKIGEVPHYFAYPFGFHNKIARECAASYYKASVTTELKPLKKGLDQSALPRLDSYYFQTPALIDRLDSFLMNQYFSVRNIMRNVKGSQCKADVN